MEMQFLKATAVSAVWFLIFVVVMAISQSIKCNAQVAGSARAYQLQRDAQTRATESEMNWKNSVKITLDPTKADAAKRTTQQGTTPSEYKVGEVGMADYWTWKILQVIDEKNCMLICGQTVVWLTKYDASKLSDGDMVHIIDPIKVTGTKQYITPNGASKTVKTIELLPLEEQELLKKKEQAEKEKELDRFLLKDGSYAVGDLVASANGVVTLKDWEGKEKKIKLSEFALDTLPQIRKIAAKRLKK